MNYEIDWEAQWASHGLNFRDGFVHVDLREYAGDYQSLNLHDLRLKPGPGFGDLSHPTTRLVLKLMQSYVKGKHVLDIGCGSGILAIAAIAMGARSATAIDIDKQALLHARENCLLNGMEHAVRFALPNSYHPENEDDIVILMNMIQSEQEHAWGSLPLIHGRVSKALTSGILAEGRTSYLHVINSRQWQLLQEVEEEGWMAFACSGCG